MRQSVVFAVHDLTKDPPFTRINLISCRNVLIYFEPEVQHRVIATFHFALKMSGVMFLGPSETTGELSREFEVIDQHWRIYRKLRDIRLPEMNRMVLSAPTATMVPSQRSFGGRREFNDEPMLVAAAVEEILSKYIPPCLMVNEFYDIVHSFGDARRMLVQPAGRPTINLLKMVENDLKTALSAGLHHADRKETAVSYSGVNVRTLDGEKTFKVIVEPFKKSARKLFMITFEEQEKKPQVVDTGEVSNFELDAQANTRISELERDLDYTRESLQATVEELETSNEELQSTNEELVASNEELQSTNEELHSVNEELHTVNAEHQRKIDELTLTNNDLQNFMSSTMIGTVFLDSQLRIRRFTPSITSIFHILERDIGRPIQHIVYSLNNPELLDDINIVLETGEKVQREVNGADGRLFTQRIQAYRNSSGGIEGVILTFDEISDAKEFEQNLNLKEKEFQDFAYAVSHDLQSPLRHLVGSTHQLIQLIGDDLSTEVKTEIDLIQRSSLLMKEMMLALLSYSRIESRGNPFTTISCDEILSLVLEHHAEEIEQKKAVITHNQLPNIEGDRSQIFLLFSHLLSNALKFNDQAVPEVHITAKREGPYWLFCVDDNGIGIENRHLDRIFVMFQRLGVKPEAEGMGQGLALCRRILDRHKGWIWCESTVGKGSSFFFRIPAVQS
ncbi:MAG: PAS domain-containing protein [Planctomycetaceae bacterium]